MRVERIEETVHGERGGVAAGDRGEAHATTQIRITAPVLGVPIDVLDWARAIERIGRWAAARDSRSIYLCNVHSVVTAMGDPAFARVLAGADMATPDGAPIAWMLRRAGHVEQQRVDGPELMLRLCQHAAEHRLPIALVGSTHVTLARLQQRLRASWPALRIVAVESPPFRPLTGTEERELAARINASGARIVFVGLGCPKQEKWIAARRGRIRAVMVGVGAAFDFHAGTAKRAPAWMRDHGLEWLHRLASEPRRLWKRYAVTNTLFLIGAARQLWAPQRRGKTSLKLRRAGETP